MRKVEAARRITGADLRTPQDMRAAIAELEADNERLGASDGRVTAIGILKEAIEELHADQSAQEERERLSIVAEQIRREKANLAELERIYAGDRWGDRMLEKALVWIDDDGRHTRRYTTERGFLKAYIRLLEADAYIIRAD